MPLFSRPRCAASRPAVGRLPRGLTDLSQRHLIETRSTLGAPAQPPLAKTVVRSWGLFFALGFLMLGNGLLGTLLGIRSELEGFATGAIGVIMAFYYVGFLVGSQLAPATVARVGHVRAFAGLASMASIAALIHAVAIDPAVWSSMRFLTGLCQAGLYVVAESWLGELATARNRGRLLSVYMVVLMGGMAVGQFFVTASDPGGFKLFVVASAMVSLSVVPVSLSIGTAPTVALPPRLAFMDVWRAAPLGIVGGIASGLSNGALISIAAVYATRVGMSPARVALFISAALAGGVLLQFPIGAISDRVHRRSAILVVTLAASVAALWSGWTDPLGWVILITMFLFGGLSFPMYSLLLSHVNDSLPPGQATAASSVFVFVTGIGSILGPIGATTAMNLVGVSGFWWLFAAVHALIGAFSIVRISVYKAMPVTAQRAFVLSPARATAVIAELATRTARKSRNLF